MEKTYNLVSYFTEKEIDEIYNYLVEYSIRNYEKNLIHYEHWKEQYRAALTLQKEMLKKGIDLSGISTEEITNFLTSKQEKYDNNLQENRMTTIELTQEAIEIFKEGVNKKGTIIERVNYLFDFVTSIVTPSNDYIKYCTQLPQTNKFEFDFKGTLPIDHVTNVESMLIQSQGTADDVTNLMLYLGRELNLTIKKDFILRNGKSYPINKIKIGKTFTLIDAYAKIKGEKTKSESFLRSANSLSNKKVKYQEKEANKAVDITLSPKTYRYDLASTHQKLNLILPGIIKEETETKKKLVK